MSWSIEIRGIQDVGPGDIPADRIEYIATAHPKYPQDLYAALSLAKAAGLRGAVLTGCRTPNPYGDDEVVDISVRGTMEASDYQAEVQRILRAGPQPSQAIPPDAVTAEAYYHRSALDDCEEIDDDE